MMLRRSFLFLIALFAAGAVVAPSAGANNARTVEIVGTDDMKFSVTTIQAKPGEQLRVRLKSGGKMPKMVMAHNFVLLKPDTDLTAFANAAAAARTTNYIPAKYKGQIIAATDMIGNGEEAEVTFEAPKTPGTYTFVCTFPGHFAAGMKGTLVVK